MKVILQGYKGKTGKLIYDTLIQRGIEVLPVDINNSLDDYCLEKNIDAIIDFSSIGGTKNALEFALNNNISLIIGTTNIEEINLKKYLMNVPVGTEVDLGSMVESIEYRGVTYVREEDGAFYSDDYTSSGEAIAIPAGRISYSGDVNFREPGVYEIKYTYADSEEGITNDTRLYLVVYE
jgi:hypothetical protein